MNARELAALVRQRIESRYRRLVFVHRELNRLNALAKLESLAKEKIPAQQKEPMPGRSFEEYVFSRIDFSLYKKIDAEEFVLLFDKGLDDYEDFFYQKAFSMNREEVQNTINNSYINAGPFYLCKKSSPLLLSIMRTLHTSLDFSPLLGSGDISKKDQLQAVAESLDGLVICHDDGMETKLFIPKADKKIPGIQGRPLLCGTFYPLGKACTIALLP